ncbi:hypothetical protein [Mycoplasma sp. Z386]
MQELYNFDMVSPMTLERVAIADKDFNYGEYMMAKKLKTFICVTVICR